MATGQSLIMDPRRTIRTPPNPMDKATVVSIFPKEIREKKITLFPGEFHIPAGSRTKPAVLVLGTSSWFREIDPDQPQIEIPVNSLMIAESIIVDYCNGLVGADGPNKRPGLFSLPGEHTSEGVIKTYSHLLNKAELAQRAYFAELITIADTGWARTHGNPRAISDDAKRGAEYLGIPNKPWMADFTAMELKNCPACGFMINLAFPVCSNCKTIVNKDAFEKAGLKQAV